MSEPITKSSKEEKDKLLRPFWAGLVVIIGISIIHFIMPEIITVFELGIIIFIFIILFLSYYYIQRPAVKIAYDTFKWRWKP